ncbi:MAG: hypothetical protein IPN86_01665 [Saprospiraceae bacterium]|nr:hypothetical protein [Saprospiraceae bacterium]
MNYLLKSNTLDKVVNDFGFASLEVSKMEKLPFVRMGGIDDLRGFLENNYFQKLQGPLSIYAKHY